MRYFLIAGEPSGDLHAAGLIEALRRKDPEAEIRFFGGDLMAKAAGCEPVVHYKSMAYMGFSEVLRHLPDIRRNLRAARAAVDSFRPDALVLIDYPSFNLRVAEYAHRKGVKTFYYIPPKVWAWKERRIKKMKRCIDRIFAIFPFETEYYKKHGIDVEYVGNPSVAEVDQRLDAAPRPAYSEADRPVLAIVPGSRVSEIRNNLPVMAEVARRHPECQAVIAGAPSLPIELYRQYTDLPVVFDSTFELMRQARAALVTSGTATLECALIGTPQVACYRANGSRLAYAIMSRWLKIPYVTLPNLILSGIRTAPPSPPGKDIPAIPEATSTGAPGPDETSTAGPATTYPPIPEVAYPAIPELLLHRCTPDQIDAALTPLLANPAAPARDAQLRAYTRLRALLTPLNPSATAAREIYNAVI